jgi:hypothetical protein
MHTSHACPPSFNKLVQSSRYATSNKATGSVQGLANPRRMAIITIMKKKMMMSYSRK